MCHSRDVLLTDVPVRSGRADNEARNSLCSARVATLAEMPDVQRRLGALLVEMGLVDEEQLEQALEEQRREGRRLGQVLIERGLAQEDPLVDALARQLGVERWVATDRPSDRQARDLLSRDLAFKARALPLSIHTVDGRNVVLLATSDPLAPSAGKVVRAMSERGMLVRWLLAGDHELEKCLTAAYTDVAPGVTIIQGRPEPSAEPAVETPRGPGPTGSGGHEGPRTGGALDALVSEEAEADLIQALDHALRSAESSPPEPSESAAPVPALEVVSPVRSGHTLLADDAVLEVVDDAPAIVSTVSELPDLGLDREAGEEAGDGAGEAVALARVAVRRPEGAIREVVPEALRARDPRDPDSPRPDLSSVGADAASELELDVLPGPVSAEPALGVSDAADDGKRTDDVFSTERTVVQVETTDSRRATWDAEPSTTTLEHRVGVFDESTAVDAQVSNVSGEAPPRSDSALRDAERIAALQAQLVRFAAGEALPKGMGEQVLRVLVAVLLERGWLDEASVDRALDVE